MTKNNEQSDSDYVPIVIGCLVIGFGVCLLGALFFLCGCMFQARWANSGGAGDKKMTLLACEAAYMDAEDDEEENSTMMKRRPNATVKSSKDEHLLALVNNTAWQLQAMQMEQQRMMQNHLHHTSFGTTSADLHPLHLKSMQHQNHPEYDVGTSPPIERDHRAQPQWENDGRIAYMQGRKFSNPVAARAYHDHDFKL